MTTTLVAITAMTILASACAIGADSADLPEALNFDALDSNADLYIDKQEFEQFRDKMRDAKRERFRGFYLAGDKGPGERMAQLYNDADTDGDGLLNEDEFNALKDSIQSMRDQMRQRWASKDI